MSNENAKSENGFISLIKKIDWSNSIFSSILVLIILVIVFGIINPQFLAPNNIVVILQNASVYGIFGIAVTFMMLCGVIDLSYCANAALSTICMGALYKAGVPLWLDIIVCFAVGICGGLINAVNITVIKIPALIATIGTQFIYRSLAYAVTQTLPVTISNEAFSTFGRAKIGSIPICIIYMLVLYVVFYFILNYTSFGRKIYAIGGNREAAYLCGINVYKNQFIIFLMTGALSALGGLIYTAQSGVASGALLNGKEFTTMSGVILGGISMTQGGKGSLIGSLIGIIVIAIINNGMVLSGIQSYWQDFTMGCILIIAIAIDVIRNRKNLKI